MKTVFYNGKIVTPTEILEGYQLVCENGKICEISHLDNHIKQDSEVVDLKGRYLVPGMIDIHSDMIESLIQPRSTALMDFSMGLEEAEKQLASCGITTIFHSVAMFREGNWDTKKIRTAPLVKKLAAMICDMDKSQHLINNRYHLRYEIDNLDCYDDICKMIRSGYVNLLSIMDHSPCQGQYRDLDVYRRHLPGEGKDLTDEEFKVLIEKELKKPKASIDQIGELVCLAKENNISVASHDDDITDKVMQNKEIGITISEFPITMEVAKLSHEQGMYTLLGAPNILRGGSHSGNLSAQDAIVAGCGDILCSDYYPQALLRAIFMLWDKGILSLPEACRLASSNPAKAVNINDKTGSLEVGKNGDMLVVNIKDDGTPLLEQTWVNGKCVLNLGYFEEKTDGIYTNN